MVPRPRPEVPGLGLCPSRFRFSLAFGIVLGVATGCDRRATAPAPDYAPALRAIIEVDGEVVSPRGGAAGTRHLLVDLLPEAFRDARRWRAVEATASGQRELHLDRPAETYPDHDLYVDVTDGGGPVLVLVRHDRPDLPEAARALARRPAVVFPDVERIRVRTKRTERMTMERKTAPLELRVTGAKPLALVEADLRPLTLVPSPRADAAPEWLLADVVGLRAAPDRVRSVRLVFAEGEPVTLGADWASDGVTRLVKWNQRGLFRMSEWRGENKLRRLEGIVALELDLAPSP